MLQPPQVQAWPGLVKADPTLRTLYHGYHLGEVGVAFANGAADPAPKQQLGLLHPPARMFGKPVDESCLHGIGAWPVHAKAPHRLALADARVIGTSAALGPDGRVYTPDDVTTGRKMPFIVENTYGHQRFLVEDAEDQVVIRFTQRQTPRRHRARAAFFYNIEPGNFGSFMFRVLPQLVQARAAANEFDCYVTPERTPFMLDALDLLGFPRKPILTVGEVCGDVFDTLTLFCVDDAEGYLSTEFLSSVRGLTAGLCAANVAVPPRPKRIYVSRALSASDRPWYRVMQNEAEIERLAEAKGFTVVYPETLRLADQMSVFSQAELVAGPSGSGMFNAMFSGALRKVLDIETFHVTVRQHAKLYSSCGAAYAFLFAPYADGQARGGLERPYLCPPALAAEGLDWLCADG